MPVPLEQLIVNDGPEILKNNLCNTFNSLGTHAQKRTRRESSILLVYYNNCTEHGKVNIGDFSVLEYRVAIWRMQYPYFKYRYGIQVRSYEYEEAYNLQI